MVMGITSCATPGAWQILCSYSADPIKHRNNWQMTHAVRWILAVNPSFKNVLDLSSVFIVVNMGVWPPLFHNCLIFSMDSLFSLCAADSTSFHLKGHKQKSFKNSFTEERTQTGGANM